MQISAITSSRALLVAATAARAPRPAQKAPSEQPAAALDEKRHLDTKA